MFYKSERVGKGGKTFLLWKVRTLKENIDKTSSFTHGDQYTRFGKFLRKTKFDELPQLYNVLRGDISFFGYRPEEKRTFDLFPREIQEIFKKYKPGIVDLSSLFFFNEEEILQLDSNQHKTYWEKIRPIKLVLQMFYIENRCWLLNLAIIWIYLKKMIFNLMKRV